MSRRTLAIILFVSLAMNVFLIGAVVGGLVVGQRFRHERPAMARSGPPLWAAANQLAPEQRRAYRQLLRGEAGEVRDGMRSVHEARTQAWRGLAAEPFDPAAAKRDLNAARLRETQIRAGVDGRIVDFAAKLPPSDRAALAEGLAQSHPAQGQGRRMQEHRREMPERP
ncbi:periplasmic heavy metal sensor [Phenylobacterium sp.]|uniref:periplasmic heavy metal sensor n=1 Tax=Phenylobacterium sp. TaxID=1871053 RepID=UPI0027358457|nr:periplasmic heavy metal sensor [Phenylobacterium sp.]MDP3853371.1 periplasmic heavy metal sensor [Phenylobacterium sp.]